MKLIARLLLIFLLLVPLWAREKPTPRHNQELETRLKAAVAKSAGIWGISVKHTERVEYAGINADKRFQMASVFKVPVLIELYRQAAAGQISLSDRVEWRNPQHYFGSGLLVNLNPGLKPTWKDMAMLMITLSDNAATDTICRRVGLDNINAGLGRIGATQTSIDRCTRDLILAALGVSEQSVAFREATAENLRQLVRSIDVRERKRVQQKFLNDCPNCTTPGEMTMIFEKLLSAGITDRKSSDDMLRILSKQQFNHRLPRLLPVGARCDHKTGTLSQPVWMVNDAGIVYLPRGEHVIVSVFSRGTEMDLSQEEIKIATASAEDRIAEIGKIVWDYYAAER